MVSLAESVAVIEYLPSLVKVTVPLISMLEYAIVYAGHEEMPMEPLGGQ